MRNRIVVSCALLLLLCATAAESRTIKLAWDANTEPDLAGYVVVYGYASGSYTESVDIGNATQATLTNIPDDKAVYFAVRAYTSEGLQSPPSSEVSVPAAGARVTIDTPTVNATVRQPFTISGWAADPASASGSGVDMVHVYAYPGTLAGTPVFLGVAAYGLARPDVAAALGDARFVASGYSIAVTKLKPGIYVLAAFAHSTVTGAWRPYTRTVRVAAGPVLFLENPVSGNVTGQPFLITGWALDTRAATGTGVDAVTVSVQPVSGGPEVLLGYLSRIYRPDVAKTYGTRFGYGGFIGGVSTLPPGMFILTVRAHSTVTRTFVIAAQAIIQSGPVTAIDTPDGTTAVHQGFTLSGWSLDRRATQNSGISQVHVYAYPSTGGAPILLGVVTPNEYRPDVAAAYGSQFLHTGYSLYVGTVLPPGRYLIALYPISTISGAFATPSTRAIDVIP